MKDGLIAESTFGLHELLFRYVRLEASESIIEYHGRFLQNLKKVYKDWKDLPPHDPYLSKNTLYHIQQANLEESGSEKVEVHK